MNTYPNTNRNSSVTASTGKGCLAIAMQDSARHMQKSNTPLTCYRDINESYRIDTALLAEKRNLLACVLDNSSMCPLARTEANRGCDCPFPPLNIAPPSKGAGYNPEIPYPNIPHPDRPGCPERPVYPGIPDHPNIPDYPDKPDGPEKPGGPGGPGNPSEPDEPGEPGAPGEPGGPVDPDEPGEPGAPDNPDNPGPPDSSSGWITLPTPMNPEDIPPLRPECPTCPDLPTYPDCPACPNCPGDCGGTDSSDRPPQLVIPPDVSLGTSVHNLIVSVALQETALARLIDAQTETLLRVKDTNGITVEQLTTLNKSITSLIRQITDLERAMCCKMKNALSALCEPCGVKDCECYNQPT